MTLYEKKSNRPSYENKIAGCIHKSGYRVITCNFEGKKIQWSATEIIWMLHYGRLPYKSHVISHRNGDRSDNRLSNLVERTVAECSIEAYKKQRHALRPKKQVA